MQVFKKLICISCCLIMLNSVHAQRTDTSETQTTEDLKKRNSFGLKYGYDRSYLKDINFSPLNYKGNGSVWDLNFKRETKKENLFFSQFDFTSTTLGANAPTPPTVNFDSDKLLINLELGFLKQIKIKPEKLKLYVGGSYHTYLDLVLYKGTNSITYFTTHGFDLSSKLTYQLHPKHKLEGGLSLSVIGLLVRPPYTGWDKFVGEESIPKILTRGKWTSLNDFVGTNFNLNYTFDISQKWSLEAQYRLRFYSTKHLKQTKTATSQTSLGVNFKF